MITGHGYRAAYALCSTVGCSERSNVSAVAVKAAFVPAAVTNIHTKSVNDTHLTIGWDFGGDNGGFPVSRYVVQAHNNNGTEVVGYQTQPHITEFTQDCTALNRGRNYVWFMLQQSETLSMERVP